MVLVNIENPSQTHTMSLEKKCSSGMQIIEHLMSKQDPGQKSYNIYRDANKGQYIPYIQLSNTIDNLNI